MNEAKIRALSGAIVDLDAESARLCRMLWAEIEPHLADADACNRALGLVAPSGYASLRIRRRLAEIERLPPEGEGP